MGIRDLGVGLMAWLNIIAIWILHKPALEALKDYEQQKGTIGFWLLCCL